MRLRLSLNTPSHFQQLPMNKQELILVTGASGFLGTHLVQLLISKGYRVRALKREHSDIGSLQYCSDKIEWFNADLTDLPGLDEAFYGVDVVCHCAAIPSFHPKDHKKMYAANVVGTTNVVNMSLHHKVRRLIHVSSIAALGRTPGRLYLDESCDWVEGKDNHYYGQTKHLAEVEVWRGIAEGLNAVMVLPSVIIGVKNWNDGIAAFWERVDKGLKFCPDGKSGFVDVRDVVLFIERMIGHDSSGERYILNAENLSHKEFFTRVARSMNKRPPYIMVGKGLAELAWRVERAKELILGATPLVTKASARAGTTQYEYDNRKSLGIGGFDYTTVDESIADMTALYKVRHSSSRKTL